ncbi:hypothetical protein FISHEDRAFT_70494 [Fistulina hepatica ATCC 64428]|uniref:C2H2-type domain-containing protein n=1 Tax=Fistulina hepatica ATCC 64428 TaxID=1128425 RepID=A0A0D7AJM5_9AGAR|nr:hypothetical protein FISHEDRAFT_70494 [Fistulina hepatica ATCC 64428]
MSSSPAETPSCDITSFFDFDAASAVPGLDTSMVVDTSERSYKHVQMADPLRLDTSGVLGSSLPMASGRMEIDRTFDEPLITISSEECLHYFASSCSKDIMFNDWDSFESPSNAATPLSSASSLPGTPNTTIDFADTIERFLGKCIFRDTVEIEVLLDSTSFISETSDEDDYKLAAINPGGIAMSPPSLSASDYGSADIRALHCVSPLDVPFEAVDIQVESGQMEAVSVAGKGPERPNTDHVLSSDSSTSGQKNTFRSNSWPLCDEDPSASSYHTPVTSTEGSSIASSIPTPAMSRESTSEPSCGKVLPFKRNERRHSPYPTMLSGRLIRRGPQATKKDQPLVQLPPYSTPPRSFRSSTLPVATAWLRQPSRRSPRPLVKLDKQESPLPTLQADADAQNTLRSLPPRRARKSYADYYEDSSDDSDDDTYEDDGVLVQSSSPMFRRATRGCNARAPNTRSSTKQEENDSGVESHVPPVKRRPGRPIGSGRGLNPKAMTNKTSIKDGRRVPRYGCPMCTTTFTRKTDVRRHVRNLHGEEDDDPDAPSHPPRRRRCLGCGEVLSRHDSRRRHEEKCPDYDLHVHGPII